ncbi:MAG: hypothetical protein KatS3mg013_2072 [Actinomycetota bacterium]|jgi:hypothetical protein|nr:MAG: hypothetical protein KatS3mg013_2072 [Actinomycetota bacterium]
MEPSPGVLRASGLATVVAGMLALTAPALVGVPALEPAATPPTRPRSAPAFVGGEVLAPRLAVDREASTPPERTRERKPASATGPHLLVRIPPGGAVARQAPRGSAPVVGRVVDRSRYYRVPTVAWVEATRRGGRWGRVELPYVFPRRHGWIRLTGLRVSKTWVTVRIDLSEHRLVVERRGRVLLRAPTATGAPSSPTPPGDYFVTDRVPFAPGGYLGSFAFGISGIQPRLPPGWTGGNQLAIHGTDAPWTIGRSASAGCLRVSERTLDRLKPLLRLGTPVIVRP